jgi:hypothetical protein
MRDTISTPAVAQAAIADHIRDSFPGIVPAAAWGETGFFYNPGMVLPRGVYFATIKTQDGANDRASRLDRPGVYRFAFGIGQPAYRALFGHLPARPAAAGVVRTGHDFAALDILLPHPVYAWMGWVGVLNPGAATFERIKPLLAQAHGLAVSKFRKRAKVA